MIKEDNQDFENSAKCCICGNNYVNGEVKVRDNYHISGSGHRNCNISVKLNHKIKPNNYDSHLIMQEPSKFSFKINVIPNGLEKYVGLNINNKLVFIDSFQYLGSSLDSLVKNLGKNDF